MISASMHAATNRYTTRCVDTGRVKQHEGLWLRDGITAFLGSPECAAARAHDIAVLIKASLDAATELDWMKNAECVKPEDRDNAEQLVARLHAACESLGHHFEAQVQVVSSKEEDTHL